MASPKRYHQIQVRRKVQWEPYIEPHIDRFNFPTRLKAIESRSFRTALAHYGATEVRILERPK